jgi:hypothetical protein
MAALLYIGVKFAAYTLWCLLGLWKVRRDSNPSVGPALGYGLFRLLMGLFFGVVIWLVSSALLTKLGYGAPQSALTYLLVYVPVRWIEWTIVALLLLPRSTPFGRAMIGTGTGDRLWRLGGIVISCLADIPLIISLGGVIPTGRFLC